MRLLFQNAKDGLSTIRWRHVAKLCIERDVVVDYSPLLITSADIERARFSFLDKP